MAQDGHKLLQRIAEQAGVPSGAHLQIADRCNHACRHCYQVQGRKGELTLDELKAIIDDLAAAGVMMLNVSGGEATLRPDLLDILRYARAKGFALRMFTNGYTMTPELAREFRRIGLLGVDVSVYSDEPTQHDAITRVPGSHERTVAGIRAMLEAGLRVHIKVPATREVPDASERVQRLARSLSPLLSVVSSSDITPMETGDGVTQRLSPDQDELVRLGVLDAWVPSEDHAAQLAAGLSQPTCGACREGVAILPNGDLRPCTDIVAPVGNLRERRFLELYKAPGPQLVRGLTWQDIHGCRDCALRPACGRCHASAAQQGGDLLGPYAAGCEAAVARYRGGVGEVRFIEPDVGCEPGRAPSMGPFRIASEGVLQAIADVLTDEDRARREQFPWLRPTRDFLEQMSHGEHPAEPRVRRRLQVLGEGA